jgi:glucose/arabinose dehydrogenase
MTILANTITAFASTTNEHHYGCTKFGQEVHCGPMTNKFDSVTATGHTQHIFTMNLTTLEPVEGVFGNALAINGYRQQYLTVPNQLVINPLVFSVSLWIKQDHGFLANSSIISHVNSAKTAGWNVGSIVVNSQSHIEFSVPNSDGKIFSALSPIDRGIFQNIVGVFDGKSVKIYLNGFLSDSIVFEGDYYPNPDVPMNIGLNAFDYRRSWNGLIDEVRLYKRAISESEIRGLADYGNYHQLSNLSSKDNGLIGYWPFEGSGEDRSGNSNDGKLILPAVNMVFSPDERLFISVREAGEIRIMNHGLTPIEEPFVKLQDRSTNATQEIFGITLDPDFLTNHYVYAYVTAKDPNTGNNFNRVIRFTESENRATDQKLLIDDIPAAGKGNPFAGSLAFGPDEKLYVATGYSNQLQPGQNINLTGKVLRINSDGTIPPDNPFPNSPVYTLGHRSMFGIAFDKATGAGIVTENDVIHHDEINLLESGGDYGYAVKQQQQYSSQAKLIQTDNRSAIEPVRTYYKIITPTQMVFYDDNRFRTLKGMFLVVSHSEGSIYALSINETGSLVKEVAINLPELRGHIISIAKAPDGEIYIAGENMYKLISIDSDTAALTYFIDLINNNNIQINDLSLNISSKVLSIDFTNNNEANSNESSPSLKVIVPKALLGYIYDVTSYNYNKTSNPTNNSVENFTFKETRRVTNVGDTIIDIELKDNVTTDKILIKGQTSTFFSKDLPSRNIEIRR